MTNDLFDLVKGSKRFRSSLHSLAILAACGMLLKTKRDTLTPIQAYESRYSEDNFNGVLEAAVGFTISEVVGIGVRDHYHRLYEEYKSFMYETLSILTGNSTYHDVLNLMVKHSNVLDHKRSTEGAKSAFKTIITQTSIVD